MNKEQPLWQRMYHDPIYMEVLRLVHYAGFQYRELEEKLEPLYRRFDKVQVQSAVYYLTTFDGQMTSKPPPLAQIMLRTNVRKIAFQLLGPDPATPLYKQFRQAAPLPYPWDKPTKPPEEPTLESLNEDELKERLKAAHARLSAVSVRSKVGKEMKKRITALHEEFRRRGKDPLAVDEELLSKK